MNDIFFESLFPDCSERSYAKTKQTSIEIETTKIIIKDVSKTSQVKITTISYDDEKTWIDLR